MIPVKKTVQELTESLRKILADKIDLSNIKEDSLEYTNRKLILLRNQNESRIKRLAPVVSQLNTPAAQQFNELQENLYEKEGNIKDMIIVLEKIVETLPQEKEAPAPTVEIGNEKVPAEIRDEIKADLNEIQKCFAAACYRSVTVLCGRVLETALFRKYFEVTGKDLLETSPGFGLGKLIAKLREHNVSFDPGITEQIHLINQVRVHSVHTKLNAFTPSKEQAHAMMLYTIDVLNKVF